MESTTSAGTAAAPPAGGNRPFYMLVARFLAYLFLAGEPLDEPTARWAAESLGVAIIDNYWQTESGWPILTVANGLEPMRSKFGSPGVPMYGYDMRLLDETTGRDIVEPLLQGLASALRQ